MYRYIKSNGQVFHETKNLEFTLEFVFGDSRVESAKEVNVEVSAQLFAKVQDILEDVAQDVAQELVSNYPVTTGSIKSNLARSSMYIPVALLDDSMPGRLRVELESFARISRLSDHTQSGKNTKNIDDARATTIDNFKEELSSRLYRESRIGTPEGQNQRNEELDKKRNTLSTYNFPEDFSVVLISNDESSKVFTDKDKLVKHIAKLIYQDIIKLNE